MHSLLGLHCATVRPSEDGNRNRIAKVVDNNQNVLMFLNLCMFDFVGRGGFGICIYLFV